MKGNSLETGEEARLYPRFDRLRLSISSVPVLTLPAFSVTLPSATRLDCKGDCVDRRSVIRGHADRRDVLRSALHFIWPLPVTTGMAATSSRNWRPRVSKRIKRVLFLISLMAGYSAKTSAYALDENLKQQLMGLDPQTRLEQACDLEVMLRISREYKSYQADKVIAYTFGPTTTKGNSVSAPGAVFRSRENWYHLSYQCETGPRHLDVKTLKYKIGAKIPRSDWEKHDLYN